MNQYKGIKTQCDNNQQIEQNLNLTETRSMWLQQRGSVWKEGAEIEYQFSNGLRNLRYITLFEMKKWYYRSVPTEVRDKRQAWGYSILTMSFSYQALLCKNTQAISHGRKCSAFGRKQRKKRHLSELCWHLMEIHLRFFGWCVTLLTEDLLWFFIFFIPSMLHPTNINTFSK